MRIMPQNVMWGCPNCDEQTRFKGLCRECTEYDDNGNPVKPVNRVRVGHSQTEKHIHKRTRADFLNQRRKQPTKKQLDLMKEMLNQTSHVCGDDCDHDHEDDFTAVGEAIKDIQGMGFAVVNDMGEEE